MQEYTRVTYNNAEISERDTEFLEFYECARHENCGRVYGNGLKLTHAVSETENYARVYESDV